MADESSEIEGKRFSPSFLLETRPRTGALKSEETNSGLM